MSAAGPAIITSAAEAEYAALRNEILKRMELRQQLIAGTLTLAGVFLSVGLVKDLVALIYPPLAAFLALAWAQNDFRLKSAAKYIREKLEPVLGLRWETWVQEQREAGREELGSWNFIVASHGGIFLLTQLLAVGIELLKNAPFSWLKGILLGFDTASVVVVALVLLKIRKKPDKAK